MITYDVVERVILDKHTFIEAPDNMSIEEVYEELQAGNPKINIKDTIFDEYNEKIIEHEVNKLPWRKEESCQTQE